MAAELVRLGKGQTLVIGGNNVEGALAKNWLETWKPFEQPIHDLSGSLHTRDEATNTATLVKERGWKKIILVTSAWHMHRSEALFKKVGLEVIPVGTDFVGTSALETHWSFYPVPYYFGFRTLALYMHEQLGRLYYKLRGWI